MRRIRSRVLQVVVVLAGACTLAFVLLYITLRPMSPAGSVHVAEVSATATPTTHDGSFRSSPSVGTAAPGSRPAPVEQRAPKPDRKTVPRSPTLATVSAAPSGSARTASDPSEPRANVMDPRSATITSSGETLRLEPGKRYKTVIKQVGRPRTPAEEARLHELGQRLNSNPRPSETERAEILEEIGAINAVTSSTTVTRYIWVPLPGQTFKDKPPESEAISLPPPTQ
jgi:hypothetical protein